MLRTTADLYVSVEPLPFSDPFGSVEPVFDWAPLRTDDVTVTEVPSSDSMKSGAGTHGHCRVVGVSGT